VLAGSLLIALIAGCSNPRENLPTHPRLSAEDTRAALAARSAAVKTVSAQGTITLTRPDGQSVRFDGAMAIRPPDHTRLRAWKFGQAIFDLTVTPDGVWMIAPQDSDRRDEIKRAGRDRRRFRKDVLVPHGKLFRQHQSDRGGTWQHHAFPPEASRRHIPGV
jgi:hypothetical protein